MSNPDSSRDQDHPDEKQRKEGFFRFSQLIAITGADLKRAIAEARARVQKQHGSWELFSVLENASNILQTMSSATLDLNEEEHQMNIGGLTINDGEQWEAPPITPGTPEWHQFFLSFSERISTLAETIVDSVADLQQVTAQSGEICNIVESAACMMHNVSASIGFTVGKEIVKEALGGTEDIEEVPEDGDLASSSEANSEESVTEETSGEPLEATNSFTVALPSSNVELTATLRSSVKRVADSPSEDGRQSKATKVEVKESNSSEVVTGANDAVSDDDNMVVLYSPKPALSASTLKLLNTPLTPAVSFEQHFPDVPKSSSTEVHPGGFSFPSLASSTDTRNPLPRQNSGDASLGSAERFELFATQSSTFRAHHETPVTCSVYGHMVTYSSDRPISVQSIENRLVVSYTSQSSSTSTVPGTIRTPFLMETTEDELHIVMDGIDLLIALKAGTPMGDVEVSMNGRRQLTITFPEVM